MAFNLTRFFAQRQLSGCLYPGVYNTQMRFVTMKASPVVAVSATETHDERNTRLNRPQSPHLTVYKPQLTSMMSISHRITGMALSAYVMGLGLGALVLPHDFPHYLEMLDDLHLSPGVIAATKFVLAFPLAYHYVNGIRHLLWDTGRGLTINQVYTTGYISLAMAIALTAVLASL